MCVYVCACQHPVGRTFCNTRLESRSEALAWLTGRFTTHTVFLSFFSPFPLLSFSLTTQPITVAYSSCPPTTTTILKTEGQWREAAMDKDQLLGVTHNPAERGSTEACCYMHDRTHRGLYNSELTKNTSNHRDSQSCSLHLYLAALLLCVTLIITTASRFFFSTHHTTLGLSQTMSIICLSWSKRQIQP